MYIHYTMELYCATLRLRNATIEAYGQTATGALRMCSTSIKVFFGKVTKVSIFL